MTRTGILLSSLLLAAAGFTQELKTVADPHAVSTTVPKPMPAETRAEVQSILLEISMASGDVRELRARLEGAERAMREVQGRLERKVLEAKLASGIAAKDAGKWMINTKAEWVEAPSQTPAATPAKPALSPVR